MEEKLLAVIGGVGSEDVVVLGVSDVPVVGASVVAAVDVVVGGAVVAEVLTTSRL